LAVNKRKVLDAARKFAQKGAKEKALKEYHALLKLDPRDAKLHLEIGDAYRRWGQIEEATAQYSRVADQYKADGFDARAVAVYKQIVNLDPKCYSAYVSLADLYQRMGLEAEAINSLQAAADGYHKEGKKREALELLRKMATLDPTNTTSRLKVAELLQQEGLEDDAISEYEEVASELARQGALEPVTSVQARILEISPDRVDVLVGLARNLIQLEQPERAEPYARRAVEAAPGDTDNHELLCEIYKALSNDEALAQITADLAKIYRERGDLDRAREITQRIPTAMEFDVGLDGDAPRLDDDLEDEALLGGGFLDDEEFLAGPASDTTDTIVLPSGEEEGDEIGFEPQASSSTFADLGEDADRGQEVLEEEPEAAPLPEGDPDQLLAEASVYMRYGKRDQALASLKAVLAQEPEHRAALEKLGEVHSEMDAVEQAVEVWTRAAELARAEGDDEGLSILRDRIAALDAEAANALAGPEATPELDVGELAEPEVTPELGAGGLVEPEVTPELDVGGLVEPELDANALADLEAAPEVDETPGESDALEDSLCGIDLEIEPDAGPGLDVEIGADSEDEQGPPAGDGDADSAIEIDIDLEGGIEIDIDPDDGADAVTCDDAEADDATPMAVLPVAESSQAEGDAGSSQQQTEDLEEAEFYFQQALYDEAEAIYKRILAVTPNHPSALLRLGEIAAARGEDPAGASGSPAQAPERTPVLAEETQPEFAVEVEVGGESGIDVPIDEVVEDGSEEEGPEPDSSALESGDSVVVVAPEPAVAEEETTPELELAGESEEEPELDLAGELEEEPELELAGELAKELDSEDAVESEVQAGDREEVEISAETEDPQVASPETVAYAESPTQSFRGEDAADTAASDDDHFDLAAELRDVLSREDETGPGASGESAVLSTVEDGFASIFSEFKQGVSATLSEEDYETRYDLGIAYHEMELYEDAIGEFRTCLESEARHLDSLHMMGACALELGRWGDSVNHLEQALATPDLPDEMRAGLYFDLGRAFQGLGDVARARSSYESARAADGSCPAVGEKLAELEAAAIESDSLPELEEESGLEGFEDLISEAETDVGSSPDQVEIFESFDDVITELEAEAEPDPQETGSFDPAADVITEMEPSGVPTPDAAVKVPPEPAPSAQTGPDPNADSASQSNPRSRRKKKISFV